MSKEVVVVGGVRTAIGKFGGSLKGVPPTELGAIVLRELLARTNVPPKDVGHVMFGNVIATEPRDLYLSASFESQMGGLPGQARAQARRSERLTRVV